MKSTNNNLCDPVKVDWIDLMAPVTSYENPILIDMKRYGEMKEHNPESLYVMMDKDECGVYLGDTNIMPDYYKANRISYYISYDPNKDEYLILMDNRRNRAKRITVIERHKYADAAVESLQRYTRVGFSGFIADKLYVGIMSFIDGYNNLSQLILSIMKLFGYNDLINIQSIIEYSILNGSDGIKRGNPFPKKYISILKILIVRTNNPYYDIYLKVYNVFKKYKFFKDSKYDADNPVVNDVIYDILTLFV